MPPPIRYERLEHKMYDNRTMPVPFPFDTDLREVGPDADAILRAADIIGSSSQGTAEGIQALSYQVGALLSDPERIVQGITIEDEHGGGSVSIDSQLTRVTISGIEDMIIPTTEFGYMLSEWTRILGINN